MKTTWTKKLTALVCSVMMLCSLCAVGVSADNGLELWDGQDIIYLTYAEEFYPYCSEAPAGVYVEDLVWTVGDESMVRYIEPENEYMSASYQAIAVGETTMTVATADGAYSDTITIVIRPAIPMTSDDATVYINTVYQGRTFAYVPSKTGIYVCEMDLPADCYGYAPVYDAELNAVPYVNESNAVELTAGETYYLFVTGMPYNGTALAFDIRMTCIGESGEQQEPTSLVLDEDEITMGVYDRLRLPAYTFEPGGDREYDSVTFSVEEGSVLSVDNEWGEMYATGVGTVTLTATADTYGWTDTVTVNVVDEKRVLTEEAPLSLSVDEGDVLAVFFTAPEDGTYVFCSATETENDDPYCVVYDHETDEELGYNDDSNGFNFAASVELTKGQTVRLALGGYGLVNDFELSVGKPTAATGVELIIDGVVSRQGDTVYILDGTWLYPDVRFLGEPTAIEEEYEVNISSETATPDEYGWYILKAGQSATCTVTTENGLTDTLTVVAIDLLSGDFDLNGKVDAADALALFYYINGTYTPNAETLGMMEITGDNKITLDDAVRLFYMASGLI